MSRLRSTPKQEGLEGTHIGEYIGEEAALSNLEMQKAKSTSPLNDILPKISTKKIQPLVFSFFEKAATLDMSLKDSRIILQQMSVQIVEDISNQILDAVRDMILQGKGKGPLLVSEEAVRRAVHPSLCESFKAALGSAHKSINKLFTLVCDEVTNWVNGSLCCSKVKAGRLVVPEDSKYKPSTYKTTSIGYQVRRILLASWCIKIELSPETEEDYYLSRPSRPKGIQTPLTIASSPKVRDTMEDAEDIQDITDVEEEDIVDEDKDMQETEATKSSRSRIRDFSRCVRCNYEKVEGHICKTIQTKLCVFCCGSCRGRVPSEKFERLSLKEPFKMPTSPSANIKTPMPAISPTISLKEAVKMVLDEEAAHLTGEELDYGSEDTASTIISIMLDEVRQMQTEGSGESLITASHKGISVSRPPCLKAVAHKIKSFFVLCYAKATLCSLLCKLCCKAGKPSYNELVIERVAPRLKDLALPNVVEDDIYKALSERIGNGQYDLFTEQLTKAISDNMVPQKERKKFRKEVRVELDVFMKNIKRWLKKQLQTPATIDPVQRVLKKIHILVHKESIGHTGVFPNDGSKASTHMSKVEDVSKINMWRTTLNENVQQQNQLTMRKYNGVILEVCKRVIGKKDDFAMIEMMRMVHQQMSLQFHTWDVKVEPSIHNIKDVADAVYKDLCRDYKKSWLRYYATYPSFISLVSDTIRKHLETPPQKKHTIWSCMGSVFAFCGGR